MNNYYQFSFFYFYFNSYFYFHSYSNIWKIIFPFTFLFYYFFIVFISLHLSSSPNFTSLLSITSLPFPSLHISLFHLTSLNRFPFLLFNSLHFTSPRFPFLLFTSLHFPSLLISPFLISSLLFSSYLFSSLLFSSLLFPSTPCRAFSTFPIKAVLNTEIGVMKNLLLWVYVDSLFWWQGELKSKSKTHL